jgi:FkbM family methyltransferase
VDYTYKHIKVFSKEQYSAYKLSNHPKLKDKYIKRDDPSRTGPFKHFLDFGTHLGEGLEEIRSVEKLDREVEIHSFEANPYTFQNIEFQNGVDYYNIAVSALDGFFNFNCEMQDDGKPQGGGSSLLDLTNWNNERVYKWKPNERFDRYKSVKVASMSITSLLDQLLPDREQKSILAKFDVEGMEYDIFDQLRQTDNFKWFSKIYVEFHEGNLNLIHPLTQGVEWLDYFESIGLDVVLWK